MGIPYKQGWNDPFVYSDKSKKEEEVMIGFLESGII